MYADLIERVGKAEAGSGELSEAVGLALDVWWIDPSANTDGSRFGPWTQSLDAALSLVERKLPGWDICISRVSDLEADAPPAPWVVSMGPPKTFQSVQDAKAPTPALSVCLALLRALSKETI